MLVHVDLDRRHYKAKLLMEHEGKPIQLVLTAEQAADLAFLANDFAQQVEPTCQEVERLIAIAASIGGRLSDLVTARAMMMGEAPPQMLDLTG